MLDQFSRTQLLLGGEAMQGLYGSSVAIFGVGGVGGYTAEALARSGVGRIDVFDDDQVCLTNLNRQVIATHSTIGRHKVDVMRERILDINPGCEVGAYKMFYMPDNADEVDLAAYDYVVDAVDTITAKLELAVRCSQAGTPLISSMGAGNKLNPALFEVADIYSTSVCPLARVIRKELRKRGIEALKVVYSREAPLPPREDMAASCKTGCVCPPGAARTCLQRRQIPASNAFVPAAAGLVLAAEVVCDLTGTAQRGPLV